MLRRFARDDAMTIAAVVHSPGPSAFCSFDELILLQTGGTPVYLGPMDTVEAYFASAGFDSSTTIEPFADFMMLVVAGKVEQDRAAATLQAEPTGEKAAAAFDVMTDFHKLWRAHEGLAPPHENDDDDPVADSSRCLRRCVELEELATQYVVEYPRDVIRQFWPSVDSKRPTPGFFGQFCTCLERAGRQQYASFRTFFCGVIIVNFIIGVFMAALVGNDLNVLGGFTPDICERQHPQLRGTCLDLQQNSFPGALQFTGFILVASAAATAAATFGAEAPIYWRECAARLNTPAYYFAKVAADVPVCACSAVASYAGFISKFVSPMSHGQLLAGFLLFYVFGYLSGYFLSFLLPYGACGLAAVGWSVFWTLLYSGTSNRIMSENRDSRWVWALSLPRWINEAWFDATTVYPFEKVRSNGPLKNDKLFDLGRQKSDYLFYLRFGASMEWGVLVCVVFFFIALFTITATKLHKKK